ncbi:uncharacterized protein LOC144351341 [Saccoglossus kowalevskii]
MRHLCGTLLTEVEAAINDRPLTHMSSSVDDLTPLTPSHLVTGRKLTSLPYIAPGDISDYSVNNHYTLNRRYHLAELQHIFWQRWSAEYLTALRERHLLTAKGIKTNTAKVRDVVLIHDDIRKCIHWHMAIITKLLPGKDGIVRAVEIRTRLGKTNRPIAKLYPLELSVEIPTNAQPNEIVVI